MLDENLEPFLVYVYSMKLKITIYPVIEVHIALLLAKKVTILAKYLDFADVFLKKLANVLSE